MYEIGELTCKFDDFCGLAVCANFGVSNGKLGLQFLRPNSAYELRAFFGKFDDFLDLQVSSIFRLQRKLGLNFLLTNSVKKKVQFILGRGWISGFPPAPLRWLETQKIQGFSRMAAREGSFHR